MVFGFSRFVFSDYFIVVLISQFLIAAGQPFIINISTKVPANWFPVKERATASRILVMAQYVGFIIPMAASPLLFEGSDMKTMLGIYTAVAFIAAFFAVAFTKEKPKIAPGLPEPVEAMSLLNVKNCSLTRILVLY